MIRITQEADDRIYLYRSLRKTPKKHSEKGVFVCEGYKVTVRMLESGLKMHSFFALEEYYNELGNLIDYCVPSERQYTADKNLMERIVGFNMHKGIMALVHQPESKAIEELLPPYVILNGIIDSENVGAIVRNAAAFGFRSLIIDSKTSSPYLRRAVRVSMGAVADMDIHFSGDLRESIKLLKNNEISIVSLEIAQGSLPLEKYHAQKHSAYVLGSEGPGIDQEILDLSDEVIHITISEAVKSINVASASAVLFYAASDTFKR